MQNHYEKPLTRETLYSGRVLKLFRDTVELENEKTATREIVFHNGGVCALALTADDEVILVRQYRHAFSDELLELPAGKLEEGENPESAVFRELSEETGMIAEKCEELLTFYPTVGYSTEVIRIYLMTRLSLGNTHPDDDEFLDVISLPFDEVFCMVMEGKIKDGKTIAAILKLKCLRESNQNIFLKGI